MRLKYEATELNELSRHGIILCDDTSREMIHGPLDSTAFESIVKPVFLATRRLAPLTLIEDKVHVVE